MCDQNFHHRLYQGFSNVFTVPSADGSCVSDETSAVIARVWETTTIYKGENEKPRKEVFPA